MRFWRVLTGGPKDPIEQLVRDVQTEYDAQLRQRIWSPQEESPAKKRVLELNADEQRRFIHAAIRHMRSWPRENHYSCLAVHRCLAEVLNKRPPLDDADLVALADWAVNEPFNYLRTSPQLTATLERHLKGRVPPPELENSLQRLIDAVQNGYNDAETRRYLKRLSMLSGLYGTRIPLVAGEAWSDAALADVEAASAEERASWIKLMDMGALAQSGKPSAKWQKAAASCVDKLGFPLFKAAVLRWMPLVGQLRTQHIPEWSRWMPDPNVTLNDANTDVLKAFTWASAAYEDADLARALGALATAAYRKVPGVGAKSARLGNACVWALGAMPRDAGLGQLAFLRVRVKLGTAQQGIDKALNAAASRLGMGRDEIEEMSVPSYGLTEVGVRREVLGEYEAVLEVTGTSSTVLRWVRPDGKPQKTVPKGIKDGYADELKELKAAAKDLQRMIPAQRDRIESLYLERRTWEYPVWRERYLDHPLVGTLARRLVWRVLHPDGRVDAVVWHDGALVGRTGYTVNPAPDACIDLWHPLHAENEAEILGWRDWLSELTTRQPFKQVHREVYLLTDAERNTATYSNRFAAHILKQHQFNALCAARGWKSKLRLMVDDEAPPPTRPIPAYGMRAEFWIESLGDDYDHDTTESGSYLYVGTDGVRFYPEDAPLNSSHVAGGGYGSAAYGGGEPVPAMPVQDVPALVFSEIMRDADLFVGVASVGNDPAWEDGGRDGRYREYWAQYSFGELSASANTRRAVLEKLVPRLKIAERCSFQDRFLVVRGDIRTYRIHLGSGNILMQPGDQYLCIVPSGRTASTRGTDGVFLPFEGDRTLAVILSKALLLASDKRINDPTITSQINRLRP